MIHHTDPLTLVAALGALEVQIATRLLHERLPVTQTHLCNVLHKTDKTVARALYNLVINQICAHSPEGWRISSDGAFRLFGIRELPQASQMPVEPEVPVDNPVETCPVGIFPQEKGRKISDSIPLTTSSTSSIKLTNLKLEENLLLVDSKLKFEPEPESETVQDPEPEPEAKTETEKKPTGSEKIQECYETALAAGIWEQTAQELAELKHVTPELINYHIGKVLAEKKEIPLAIYRIRFDKSSKKTQVRKPPERRSQGYEDRQKYVEGKYAAWINH